MNRVHHVRVEPLYIRKNISFRINTFFEVLRGLCCATFDNLISLHSQNGEASLFEVNIRYVGGLLAAYYLTGEEVRLIDICNTSSPVRSPASFIPSQPCGLKDEQVCVCVCLFVFVYILTPTSIISDPYSHISIHNPYIHLFRHTW